MPNRVIRAEISGQECGTNYMAPVLNVSTSLVPPELGYNAAHTMVSVFSLFFCFVFLFLFFLMMTVTFFCSASQTPYTVGKKGGKKMFYYTNIVVHNI